MRVLAHHRVCVSGERERADVSLFIPEVQV